MGHGELLIIWTRHFGTPESRVWLSALSGQAVRPFPYLIQEGKTRQNNPGLVTAGPRNSWEGRTPRESHVWLVSASLSYAKRGVSHVSPPPSPPKS